MISTVSAASSASLIIGSLADVFGRVHIQAAEAMRSITELDGVGVQNETEAEIQRRQVTRVGAERGLVGTQNATEAEILRRIFTFAGLVGTQNKTEQEILRRCVTVNFTGAQGGARAV